MKKTREIQKFKKYLKSRETYPMPVGDGRGPAPQARHIYPGRHVPETEKKKYFVKLFLLCYYYYLAQLIIFSL